jgi:hypothetical protein
MRQLPGYSLGFILAVLLIGTTPVGTGVGSHQFELVHPLFSHFHIVDGRVLTHEQIHQGSASTGTDGPVSRGPAYGASSGGDSASDMGITGQAVPDPFRMPLDVGSPWLWLSFEGVLPPGLPNGPPDPPPVA